MHHYCNFVSCVSGEGIKLGDFITTASVDDGDASQLQAGQSQGQQGDHRPTSGRSSRGSYRDRAHYVNPDLNGEGITSPGAEDGDPGQFQAGQYRGQQGDRRPTGGRSSCGNYRSRVHFINPADLNGKFVRVGSGRKGKSPSYVGHNEQKYEENTGHGGDKTHQRGWNRGNRNPRGRGRGRGQGHGSYTGKDKSICNWTRSCEGEMPSTAAAAALDSTENHHLHQRNMVPSCFPPSTHCLTHHQEIQDDDGGKHQVKPVTEILRRDVDIGRDPNSPTDEIGQFVKTQTFATVEDVCEKGCEDYEIGEGIDKDYCIDQLPKDNILDDMNGKESIPFEHVYSIDAVNNDQRQVLAIDFGSVDSSLDNVNVDSGMDNVMVDLGESNVMLYSGVDNVKVDSSVDIVKVDLGVDNVQVDSKVDNVMTDLTKDNVMVDSSVDNIIDLTKNAAKVDSNDIVMVESSVHNVIVDLGEDNSMIDSNEDNAMIDSGEDNVMVDSNEDTVMVDSKDDNNVMVDSTISVNRQDVEERESSPNLQGSGENVNREENVTEVIDKVDSPFNMQEPCKESTDENVSNLQDTLVKEENKRDFCDAEVPREVIPEDKKAETCLTPSPTTAEQLVPNIEWK
ncbi:uncharacterized protein [Cherax quadricarinatus]|uniref:uncharacterized protein isoform X2 n=1 Tax=Cherax quadricarinatus TaxID=27406 RepID=UPI00387ECE47